MILKKFRLAQKTELNDSQPGPDHPDDLDEPDPLALPEYQTLVLDRKLAAQFFTDERFFEDFYNEEIVIFIFIKINWMSFFKSDLTDCFDSDDFIAYPNE